MQKRSVRGVDSDFQRLQPVALNQSLERERIFSRCRKAVDLGKRGRLALAQIGPEDAALFDNRIGALPDVLAERRACGLRRSFKTLALDVEEPSVKGAAKASVLETTESEVRTAVRTIAIHQSVLSCFVLEEDEVLTE